MNVHVQLALRVTYSSRLMEEEITAAYLLAQRVRMQLSRLAFTRVRPDRRLRQPRSTHDHQSH